MMVIQGVDLMALAELLLLLTTSTIPFQADAQECSIHLSCGECIGTAGCSWCSSNPLPEGVRPCGTAANLAAANCSSIEDPHSQEVDTTRSTEENPVNVTNVQLRLRVGEPQTFSVTVTPLRDLPLDLYVLIDLSASMLGNLVALKSISGQIKTSIEKLTNNVRIGFGSFNDKATRPFTDFQTVSEGMTCTRKQCMPNYAFRHQINLIDNITFYDRTLQSVETTFNTDRPENGLEALAQVVACEDIIGWRDRGAIGMDRGLSRVVLFMTDEGFHYAGEGQFAGILKPYEGECLLDAPEGDESTVEFTKWDKVDYPSVGQVIQMLQEKEVAVIFAITQDRIITYDNLAALINTRFRASVSQLTENGTELLGLIDKEYRRILQEVRLVPDDSDELQISVLPTCPPGTNETATGCDRVSLDEAVEFKVTVTLNSCANYRNASSYRTHRVVAPGFGDFTITYRGDCVCDCERNLERPNPVAGCSFNGDFVCGVCECYPGWCGSSCELMIGAACACEDLTETCPRNAIDGQLCFGQGACCSGTCICRNNSNGFFYRHSANQMDCACPPAEEVCRANPNDPEIGCANGGTCGCRGCECQSGFFGRLCQSRDINTCNDRMDKQCLQKCVDSEFNSTVCMECEANRLILSVEMNEQIQDVPAFVMNEANRRLASGASGSYEYELDCETMIGEDCTYVYYLLRGQEMYALVLLKKPAFCLSDLGGGGISLPFEPYLFAPMILGVLIILGIIIFTLAKIVIAILDYMEVRRLKQETKNVKFMDQNPLYQNPEMKYDNVAYGRE